MRRFFFNPETLKGNRVVLSPAESHHIIKVLRLQTGNPVELLDGSGKLYSATITTVGKQVEASIESLLAEEAQAGKNLTVRQGILKGEKMDELVRKCTELGVSRLSPFHSSRCQGKLVSQKSVKKNERWQRIGRGACKQCLRLRPMEIDIPASYTEVIGTEANGGKVMRLLFWEEEKTTHLRDIHGIGSAQSIKLLLGPEGGFTPEEVELARANGYRSVSLGERILRAETATLTAVSLVQYLAGNL